MNKKLINIVKGDINTAIQNGNYIRNTDTQTNIEFNTPTKQILLDGVPYSNSPLTKVTWQELKDLRDNSKLIPGSFYRITDYQCTTTQENTRSAGHQFDIVLLALSANKLAEEGWAMMNESNIYDVTFSDGITKKCYVYKTGEGAYNIVNCDDLLGQSMSEMTDADWTVNEENKTIIISEDAELPSVESMVENLTYNYFQNSNLSAWKVWYQLEPDYRYKWCPSNEVVLTDNRFVLIRYKLYDSNNRYCWGTFKAPDLSQPMYMYYSTSLHPNSGDKLYTSATSTVSYQTVNRYISAKGVIYRLIDDIGNDCPYDFKNIVYFKEGSISYSYLGGTPIYAATNETINVENTVYYKYVFVSGSGNPSAWLYRELYAEKSIKNIDTDTSLYWLNNGSLTYFIKPSTIEQGYEYYTFYYTHYTGNGIVDSTVLLRTLVFNNKIEPFRTYNSDNQYYPNTLPKTILKGNIVLNNHIKADCHDIEILMGKNITINECCNNIFTDEYCEYINIEKNCNHISINKPYSKNITILTNCANVTLSSHYTVSQYNYLEHITIGSGFSSATTIYHDTVRDLFLTTYVPAGSTTVEVS